MTWGRGNLVLVLVLIAAVGCKKEPPRELDPGEQEQAPADKDAASGSGQPAIDAAPKPSRGDGPAAGILYFKTSEQGMGDDDDTVPFEVEVEIHLDHTLGFVEAPVLEVGARSGGAEVKRSVVTEREDLVLTHQIALPTIGKWSLDLYADGKYVRSLVGTLSKSLCTGGKRVWSEPRWSGPDVAEPPPELASGGIHAGRTPPDEHFSFTRMVSFTALADEPAFAIAEWVRDGKVVLRQEQENRHIDESFKSLAGCVEADVTHEFVVPEDELDLFVAGDWQLRIFSSTGKATESAFKLDGKEAERASSEEEGSITLGTNDRGIPMPPAVAKELAARVAAVQSSATYKAKAPQLRAVIRNAKAAKAHEALEKATADKNAAALEAAKKSFADLVAKHGGPFKSFERTPQPKTGPKQLKAELPKPPKSGCDRSRCSSYPALSPSHDHIIHRIRMCIGEDYYGGGEAISRHYELAADGSEEGPSRNVVDYQPLACGKTGFKVVSKEGEHTLVGKGKKRKLDADGAAEAAAVCAFPKDKTVLVVWEHPFIEGLTGEPLCVERSSFELVSY